MNKSTNHTVHAYRNARKAARHNKGYIYGLLRKATDVNNFDVHFSRNRRDLMAVVQHIWPMIKDDPRIVNYAKSPESFRRYEIARAARFVIKDGARLALRPQ